MTSTPAKAQGVKGALSRFDRLVNKACEENDIEVTDDQTRNRLALIQVNTEAFYECKRASGREVHDQVISLRMNERTGLVTRA